MKNRIELVTGAIATVLTVATACWDVGAKLE